jgi:O-antigen/teichoic acid export membrane protein
VLAYCVLPVARPKWPRWQDMRAALGEGAPFLVAAFASLIYLRIDQVMLGAMAPPTELAGYAIAARLSEMAMFVPAVLQSVCYARLVAARNSPDGAIAARRTLFAVFAAAGWLVAGGVALAAQLLLVPVFGPAYSGAVPMTLILALGLPFAFLTIAMQMVLNTEGKPWLVPAMAGCAALLNVMLNLVLIPRMGGTGAAIATLAAAIASGLLPALLHGPTRQIGRDMLASLNPQTFVARLAAIRGTFKTSVVIP